VLSTGTDAGGSICTTIFGETCMPGSTCVNGACQALCYCTPDCPTGQCCTDASAQGFSLCGSCM
jgi:hypothetical protein